MGAKRSTPQHTLQHNLYASTVFDCIAPQHAAESRETNNNGAATLCDSLQQHFNTVQHTAHTATHCISNATRCNTVPSTVKLKTRALHTLQHAATRCNTLQHAAIRCKTLQHTAARFNMLPNPVKLTIMALQRTASQYDNPATILQDSATTLQQTAMRCNTLLHAATHCDVP